MPALLGKSETGHAEMIEEARTLALRRGHWKYVQPGKGKRAGELYNLESDIGEQNNVVEDNPEVSADMRSMLKMLKEAKTGVRAAGG